MIEKINELAQLIEKDQEKRLIEEGYNPELQNFKVKTHIGKKYIRVDIGNSGAYMIDEAGQIFGIKAYGVIHKGHFYGTLDTIKEYDWGGYRASKKAV